MALTHLKSTGSFSSVEDILNCEKTSINDKIAMAVDFKQPFRGSLEMIIGPMFAGKSTELLRRMDRHRYSGKKCLYVKYSEDNRYDAHSIATHD
jgi:ABC-type phosphate/phosphonate transport system ATPase subunit